MHVDLGHRDVRRTRVRSDGENEVLLPNVVRSIYSNEKSVVA